MFIAQVDEVDIYTKSGRQVEDINSLVQYLAKVFHYKHKPIKDSDDDNARYFHFENASYSFFNENFIDLKKPFSIASKKRNYPPYLQKKISSTAIDIQSPPPEA